MAYVVNYMYAIGVIKMENAKTNLSVDETKINKIDELINNACFEDALELNIRTYEEALANDQIEVIAYCLYYFGMIEDKKVEPGKAMAFYKKATILARKNNLNECLVKSLNARGNLYVVSGEHHMAIKKYLEAISIVDSDEKCLDYKVKILNNLGLLYLNVKDCEQALKYFMECAQIAKETNDKLLHSTAYTNLTEVYIKKKTYLKAKYYNRLSEQLSKDIDDQVGVAIALSNEAIILHREKHKWDKAHKLFVQAIELIETTNEEVDRDDILLKYGIEARKAGDNQLAESVLKDLAKFANQKTYFNTELNALVELEQIYASRAEYKKAYKASRRQLEIKERAYSQWQNTSLESLDKNISETTEFSQVDDLQKSIKTLKLLSEIGQKITACVNDTEIFEILLEDAKDIFNCEAFGVGIKSHNDILIDYRFFDDNGYEEFEISIFDTDYLMANCINAGEDIIIYDTRDHEFNRNNFTDKLFQIIEGSDNETIIFCPIKFEKKTIGGITIQSVKKGQLSYLDLESLRVLAAYLAIAYTNLERSKELIVANKKLEQASMLDGLTGVYNRHALGQYIGREFIGMLETKLPATALMIDIDYFKQYNDNYGHVMGDKCLKKVCGALRNSLSSYKHRLFRYGGDEFFVVIEGCGFDESKVLLNKILTEMKNLNIEHLHSKIEDRVTLTIGAAVIEYSILDYTIVFTSADEALYVAKDGGRNGYHVNVITDKAKVVSV